jgi:hypothetical protein
MKSTIKNLQVQDEFKTDNLDTNKMNKTKLVKRYTKFNEEGKAYKKSSFLTPVKNVVKKGFAFSAIVGGALLGVGIAQEAYEEFTTENEIVDVGPFILKHKEERSVDQMYADIERAVLNIDGIEKAINPDSRDLTREEKADLLDNIAKTIGEEANIKTDSYTESSVFKGTERGAYLNAYLGAVSTPSGSVLLRDSLLDHPRFRDAVKVLIHEMLHAVELENNLMSDNVNRFDKKLYGAGDFFSKDIYNSSFLETNTILMTNKIISSLHERYNPYQYYEMGKTRHIFNEIIQSAYGVEYESKPVLQELVANTKGKIIPNENYDNYKNDVHKYNYKTLEELIMIGYKQKLDDRNINYEDINLKDTYYYKTAMYALGQDKNVRLLDYQQGFHTFSVDNLQESITDFESKVNSDLLGSYKIASSLGEYTSLIRYSPDKYSKEDKQLILNTVNKHIDKVKERHIEKLGIQDAKKVLENSVTIANIKNDNSNTNEPRLLTPDDIEWNP